MPEAKRFLKLMVSGATDELASYDHTAFILLYWIARRARYHDGFSIHGLKPGQAMIGDYKRMGLTEQKYRGAKQRLENYGFATFKATTRGTVATLTDTAVYDLLRSGGNGQGNTRATDGQRSSNGRATTNTEEERREVEVKRVDQRGSAPLTDKEYFDQPPAAARPAPPAPTRKRLPWRSDLEKQIELKRAIIDDMHRRYALGTTPGQRQHPEQVAKWKQLRSEVANLREQIANGDFG